MTNATFGLQLPDATREAALAYDKAIRLQIDELNNQLQLLQALCRANGSAFKIDRRDDVGKMGLMADAANRAEYEGEDGGQRQDNQGRLKVAK